MHVRVTVAMTRMTGMIVAVRLLGFGGIAGLDHRSVRVLVHR